MKRKRRHLTVMELITPPTLSATPEMLQALTPEQRRIYQEMVRILVEHGLSQESAEESAYRCFFVK
jgi:hypothetical protein